MILEIYFKRKKKPQQTLPLLRSEKPQYHQQTAFYTRTINSEKETIRKKHRELTGRRHVRERQRFRCRSGRLRIHFVRSISGPGRNPGPLARPVRNLRRFPWRRLHYPYKPRETSCWGKTKERCLDTSHPPPRRSTRDTQRGSVTIPEDADRTARARRQRTNRIRWGDRTVTEQ